MPNGPGSGKSEAACVRICLSAFRQTDNPPQEDLAYRAMQSAAFAPAVSREHRLAELDDLHRRGLITDDERRDARAEALRA